ncbi:MAG: DUF805 domain-containing protein [Halopseudomonas aestusnigri]
MKSQIFIRETYNVNIFYDYCVPFLKRFMSIDGRATRCEFWMVHFFSYLVLIIGVVFLSTLQVKIILHSINPHLGVFIFIILFCLTVTTQIMVGIRRLHDLNMGSWAYGLTFIPILGFTLFFFSAGFLKSYPENNRYGLGPIKKNFNYKAC